MRETKQQMLDMNCEKARRSVGSTGVTNGVKEANIGALETTNQKRSMLDGVREWSEEANA